MSVIENIMNIPAEHEKNVFGSFDGNIKKIGKKLDIIISVCYDYRVIIVTNL